MNKKIKYILLAMIILAVVAVSGCVSDDDTTTDTKTADENNTEVKDTKTDDTKVNNPLLKLFGVPEGYKVDEQKVEDNSLYFKKDGLSKPTIRIADQGSDSIDTVIQRNHDNPKIDKLDVNGVSVSKVFDSSEEPNFSYYFQIDGTTYAIWSDTANLDKLLSQIIK